MTSFNQQDSWARQVPSKPCNSSPLCIESPRTCGLLHQKAAAVTQPACQMLTRGVFMEAHYCEVKVPSSLCALGNRCVVNLWAACGSLQQQCRCCQRNPIVVSQQTPASVNLQQDGKLTGDRRHEGCRIEILRGEGAQQDGAGASTVPWHMVHGQSYIWGGCHPEFPLVACMHPTNLKLLKYIWISIEESCFAQTVYCMKDMVKVRSGAAVARCFRLWPACIP